MTRALLLAALAGLTACATDVTPDQRRTQCEAERTRRGISRLLSPDARRSPDCATSTN
jgi:hypothetical protein